LNERPSFLMLEFNDPQYFTQLKKIFNETRLEGDHIYLRRLKETDISEKYVSFFSNPELVKYMYQSPRKVDLKSLRAELQTGEETGQFHLYGIFDKTNHSCIGNLRIGYMNHAQKNSDLSIFIGDTGYLGKGLAQEALRLGNQASFEIYDFRKLHSGMFEANIASIKAYLKTGWVIEGRLRGQYWVEGKAMDRIAVACFNPRYFSSDFLSEVKRHSLEYQKALPSR